MPICTMIGGASSIFMVVIGISIIACRPIASAFVFTHCWTRMPLPECPATRP